MGKKALLIFLILLSSCATLKETTKDPSTRNSVYGSPQAIINATTKAFESNGYTTSPSHRIKHGVTGYSINELDSSKGYLGYLLHASFTKGKYGGSKIEFIRQQVRKSKSGNIQKRTEAPDYHLFKALLRQIQKQVMQ